MLAMMALGCGVGVSKETSYKQVTREVWGDTPFRAPSLHHRCSHHGVPLHCRPQGEGAADYVLALPGQRANINVLRTVSLCSPGWL